MSSNARWSHHEEAAPEGAIIQSSAYDDAEKGLFDSTPSLPVISSPANAYVDGGRKALCIETHLSPTSPVHEGLTPFSSVPHLSLSWPRGLKHPHTPSSPPPEATTSTAPAAAPPPPKAVKTPKPKPSRWTLFQLWFNTYRKFFILVTAVNLTGIILAAVGRFPYAENHLGALVLGNLLCAILMRTELFLRFLYLISIYGLRSVRPSPSPYPCAFIRSAKCNPVFSSTVGSGLAQAGGDINSAARRRHPLGLRAVWRRVSSHSEPFHNPARNRNADGRHSWLVYKVVDIIRFRSVQHGAVIAAGIITNVAVIISVLSAFPWVRKSVSPPPVHLPTRASILTRSCVLATTTTPLRGITASSDGLVLRYVYLRHARWFGSSSPN